MVQQNKFPSTTHLFEKGAKMRLLGLFVSKETRQFGKLIEQTVVGIYEYRIKLKNNTTLWVGNGFWFLNINDCSCLSLIQKLYLWKSVNRGILNHQLGGQK